jgi:hypothetical protein
MELGDLDYQLPIVVQKGAWNSSSWTNAVSVPSWSPVPTVRPKTTSLFTHTKSGAIFVMPAAEPLPKPKARLCAIASTPLGGPFGLDLARCGCPAQALVTAFFLDERTVADW